MDEGGPVWQTIGLRNKTVHTKPEVITSTCSVKMIFAGGAFQRHCWLLLAIFLSERKYMLTMVHQAQLLRKSLSFDKLNDDDLAH